MAPCVFFSVSESNKGQPNLFRFFSLCTLYLFKQWEYLWVWYIYISVVQHTRGRGTCEVLHVVLPFLLRVMVLTAQQAVCPPARHHWWPIYVHVCPAMWIFMPSDFIYIVDTWKNFECITVYWKCLCHAPITRSNDLKSYTNCLYLTLGSASDSLNAAFIGSRPDPVACCDFLNDLLIPFLDSVDGLLLQWKQGVENLVLLQCSQCDR